MKERVRQKAAGHWIIHPCSSFRFLFIPSAVSSTYTSLRQFQVLFHPCSRFWYLSIPAHVSCAYTVYPCSNIRMLIHSCFSFTHLFILAPVSGGHSSLLQFHVQIYFPAPDSGSYLSLLKFQVYQRIISIPATVQVVMSLVQCPFFCFIEIFIPSPVFY
jgi:hypothetical protein